MSIGATLSAAVKYGSDQCALQLAHRSGPARDLGRRTTGLAEKLLRAQPDFTIERYRALPYFRNLPD
jgi:hypothetical protein